MFGMSKRNGEWLLYCEEATHEENEHQIDTLKFDL